MQAKLKTELILHKHTKHLNALSPSGCPNQLFPLAYFKQKQHTDSNLNQFAKDAMTELCLDKLAICLIGTFDSKVSKWQNKIIGK